MKTTYYLEPIGEYTTRAMREHLRPEDVEDKFHKKIVCADGKRRDLVEFDEADARFFVESLKTDKWLGFNIFADLDNGDGIWPSFLEPSVPNPAFVPKKDPVSSVGTRRLPECKRGNPKPGLKVTVDVRVNP